MTKLTNKKNTSRKVKTVIKKANNLKRITSLVTDILGKTELALNDLLLQAKRRLR